MAIERQAQRRLRRKKAHARGAVVCEHEMDEARAKHTLAVEDDDGIIVVEGGHAGVAPIGVGLWALGRAIHAADATPRATKLNWTRRRAFRAYRSAAPSVPMVLSPARTGRLPAAPAPRRRRSARPRLRARPSLRRCARIRPLRYCPGFWRRRRSS